MLIELKTLKTQNKSYKKRNEGKVMNELSNLNQLVEEIKAYMRLEKGLIYFGTW